MYKCDALMVGYKQKKLDWIKLCVSGLFGSRLFIVERVWWQITTNIGSMRKQAKISPILVTLRSPFFGTFKTL